MAEAALRTRKGFKTPKTLAQCADLLYETQQERYALQKQIDALAAEETVLREHLIDNLPKSQATGVTGRVANATIVSKDIVKVEDWDKLYAYIVANQKRNPGVWALMQRRVGDATVKEMTSAGKPPPGTKIEQVPSVSLHKVAQRA